MFTLHRKGNLEGVVVHRLSLLTDWSLSFEDHSLFKMCLVWLMSPYMSTQMLKVYQPWVWLPCRMHKSQLVDSFFGVCFWLKLETEVS